MAKKDKALCHKVKQNNTNLKEKGDEQNIMEMIMMI